MQQEPNRLEMLLTKLAFLLYGKSVYKSFADRLPIAGNERVLDFGCGMGAIAYYTSKQLTHGSLTCLDISRRWLNSCCKTLRNYGNVTFLHAEATALPSDSFDIVYCHFVLHDIAINDLETVIPALARALKSGGSFIFRDPLNETKKLKIIRRLIEQSELSLKESRIIDVPLMGNALESVYIK